MITPSVYISFVNSYSCAPLENLHSSLKTSGKTTTKWRIGYLCLQLRSIVIMMEKQYLCPSFYFFFNTLLNCCVFGKLKNPTSDKLRVRFDFWDNGCVWYVKYWILHLKEQNELCYQLWYFLMMNKRGLTLNCGIVLWESSALLLCTESHDWGKKKTPTWSPGHASLTKTVTESIPLFCSQRFVPINKASFLFTDPPTIPAVCSTLVMCFLCPSLSFTASSSSSPPRHRTWWWYTLWLVVVPK